MSIDNSIGSIDRKSLSLKKLFSSGRKDILTGSFQKESFSYLGTGIDDQWKVQMDELNKMHSRKLTQELMCHSPSPPEEAPLQSHIEKSISRICENETERKEKIIGKMLSGEVSTARKKAIFRRLQKYPENVLNFIEKNGVKISSDDVSSSSSDYGGYNPENKTIKLKKTGYNDFFYNHPKISSFLSLEKFRGKLLASSGIGVAAAIAFSASAAGIIAGTALPPLALAALVRVRALNAAAREDLSHEFAHSLGHSLSLSEKYREQPVDERVKTDKRILGVYWEQVEKQVSEKLPHIKEPFTYIDKFLPYIAGFDSQGVPQDFSYKSPKIIDAFLDCHNHKEGHNFVTDESQLSLPEYFAESVASYVNQEKDPSGRYRENLYKKDPAMYKIIDKLFKEIPEINY